MKILGVDPGLSKCGWALLKIHNTKKYELFKYGEIKTVFPLEEKEFFLSDRLRTIFLELEKILKKYKPDVICIESQFYSKISKNMINTYFATGIVYLLCGLYKIPLKEFSAKTIKLAVTGFGSASKFQIKKMIKLLLNSEKEINSEHINDAIAVAICYLNTRDISYV